VLRSGKGGKPDTSPKATSTDSKAPAKGAPAADASKGAAPKKK